MKGAFEDLESPYLDGELEFAVPVNEMSHGLEGAIGESPFAKYPDSEAPTMPESSLYDRLGGVFAIAAVIDRFSDAVVRNPIVGKESKNPALRQWHTNNLGRLPGLKFMRTLWVCAAAGGPFHFSATRPGRTALGLEEAHRHLRISPEEFDAVAAELARTLDAFNVPEPEKQEVLGAFAARKKEVTEGSVRSVGYARHARNIGGPT
jgi:hemoglobin